MHYKTLSIIFIINITSCSKPATIKNFKAEDFKWEIDQLIFKEKNNKLYQINAESENEKAIYEFKEKDIWLDNDVIVSPDSRYILIDDYKLYLMNVDSQKIRPLNYTMEVRVKFDRSSNQHKNIQWSSDSQNFAFIAKDTTNLDQHYLHIYSIENNSPIKIITLPKISSFYFSKDNQRILYKFFKNENETSIREISIKTEEIVMEYNTYPDERIFVNATTGDLFNHTPNLKYQVIDSWEYFPNAEINSGNYLISKDTLRLLVEGTVSGENFKGFTSSNRLSNYSYFLPGGRYYVYYANCRQYEGYLLLDIKTRKYQKLGSRTKFYFALNSNHFGETINGKLDYLHSNRRNTHKHLISDFEVVY